MIYSNMKHLHKFTSFINESTTQEVLDFCKNHRITPDEFSGKEKIKGNLDLSGLKTIPQGFSLTVGGTLDLSGLKTIPQGFSPHVGGNLELRSLKTIPNGTGFDKVKGKIWVTYDGNLIELDTLAKSIEWIKIK